MHSCSQNANVPGVDVAGLLLEKIWITSFIGFSQGALHCLELYKECLSNSEYHFNSKEIPISRRQTGCNIY